MCMIFSWILFNHTSLYVNPSFSVAIILVDVERAFVASTHWYYIIKRLSCDSYYCFAKPMPFSKTNEQWMQKFKRGIKEKLQRKLWINMLGQIWVSYWISNIFLRLNNSKFWMFRNKCLRWLDLSTKNRFHLTAKFFFF